MGWSSFAVLTSGGSATVIFQVPSPVVIGWTADHYSPIHTLQSTLIWLLWCLIFWGLCWFLIWWRVHD
jgi:hypothetical protein